MENAPPPSEESQEELYRMMQESDAPKEPETTSDEEWKAFQNIARILRASGDLPIEHPDNE